MQCHQWYRMYKWSTISGTGCTNAVPSLVQGVQMQCHQWYRMYKCSAISGTGCTNEVPSVVQGVQMQYHQWYRVYKCSTISGTRCTDAVLDSLLFCVVPVGPRFSAAVQTGPEDHPAFVQCVPGLFPGGKVAGAWQLSTPISVEVKERAELDIYFPSCMKRMTEDIVHTSTNKNVATRRYFSDVSSPPSPQ